MLKNVSLVVLLVLGLACAGYAADIYVNAAAAPGGDGSKATPYQTINMALYAANAASGADTIHVAEGIYKYSDPNDPNSAGTGWTVTYPVTILGGYSKLNTAHNTVLPFDYRLPHVCVTLLSGDINGNDIDVSLFQNPNVYNNADPNVINRGDNKLAFTVAATAVGSTFDGLFFTNFGKATPGGIGAVEGAGVNANAAVTVNDCVFTKFACTSVVYYNENGQTITNCRFENNGVGNGCVNHYRGIGDTHVDNCTFVGNSSSSAYNDGICITRVDPNRTIDITNCLFAEGMYSGASNYSAIAGSSRGGTTNIENCTFLGNESTAGVLFYNARYSNTSGYPTTNHLLNIKRCLFAKNLGLAANGTILLRYQITDATNYMTVNMDHTVIADNRDGNAGGIKFDGGFEKPSNFTVNIKNSIIWGNKRPNGTSTDNLSWNTALFMFTNTTYNPFNITYSCIDTSDPNNIAVLQYGSETPRTGLIFTDPKFADPNNSDYHLDPNSPCIDAGEPGYAYVGDEPRPYNGYRQNIGLYGGTREATNKANPCSLTADSDNNGVVDLSDLSNLRLQWLKSCP